MPTSRIVANLRNVGWEPVEAREQRVRLPGRKGFQYQVTEASLRILEQVERVTDSVEAFKGRILEPEAAITLATLVWRMRFPVKSEAPITPSTLLRARRAGRPWMRSLADPQ